MRISPFPLVRGREIQIREEIHRSELGGKDRVGGNKTGWRAGVSAGSLRSYPGLKLAALTTVGHPGNHKALHGHHLPSVNARETGLQGYSDPARGFSGESQETGSALHAEHPQHPVSSFLFLLK